LICLGALTCRYMNTLASLEVGIFVFAANTVICVHDLRCIMCIWISWGLCFEGMVEKHLRQEVWILHWGVLTWDSVHLRVLVLDPGCCGSWLGTDTVSVQF